MPMYVLVSLSVFISRTETVHGQIHTLAEQQCFHLEAVARVANGLGRLSSETERCGCLQGGTYFSPLPALDISRLTPSSSIVESYENNTQVS